MPLDRADTLKRAKTLLGQGQLEGAIAEYVRLLEEHPQDWSAANALGDLYVQAGHAAQAVEQYTRIADAFLAEGVYAKAAALFKKVLKLDSRNEAAQLRIAEISQAQGLLADAKAQFAAIAARRRDRGDTAGAAEIVVRIGEVDPEDVEARRAAAKALVELGRPDEAASRLRDLHHDLVEGGQHEAAFAALQEAVALQPADREGRRLLVSAARAAGRLDVLRDVVDRETAGDDVLLLEALLDRELTGGSPEAAGELATVLAAPPHARREDLLERAWSAAEGRPDAAFAVASAVARAAGHAGDPAGASAILMTAAARVPQHRVAALNQAASLAGTAGLEEELIAAQTLLADACLEAGLAAEARAAAEDLIARQPWDGAHLERFRRALSLLKVPEPDFVIARRLAGETPFSATDPLAPGSAAPPEPAISGPPPGRELESEVEAEASIGAPAVRSRSLPVSALAPEPLGEVDLTGALGALRMDDPEPPETGDPAPPETGDPAAALEGAFRDFREAVARHDGADHAAQFLTIGRTYVQMGMHDQALEPLRAASQSSRFRFEAAALLGRIHRERGELAAAIEWLTRAADAPAPDASEAREVLYALGCALEEAGDPARALGIFRDLQAGAGTYRDVTSRIERLSGVQAGG